MFSRHYFLHELVYLAFSLQLADAMNNFEVILTARGEKYKKRFVKRFLNVIFKCCEILHSSSFSPFLIF